MPGTVRPVVDELDGLLAYLDQQRYVLKTAAYGLSDAQARMAASTSTLTVGGLIKHCVFTEAHWCGRIPGSPPPPVALFPGQDAYRDGFTLHEDESLAGVLATWAEVASHTETVVRTVGLDKPVPVPRDAPWFPADVEAWSVRWVMLHLIAETARHAGHADLVREGIDGATAYPLMAAAEQWNVPWMPAWKPAG